MSDETKNELLINALLDDQLDATEAQRARQQIANDKDLSEMLASFQEQRAAILNLPKFELDDDFADRIVEIGAAEVAAVPKVNRPIAPVSKVDWKRYAMSLAAIAALLMGMLVYQWTPGGQETASLNPAADLTGISSSADDDQVAVIDNKAMKKSTISPSDFDAAVESSELMDDPAPIPEMVAASPAPRLSTTGTQSRSTKMQSLTQENYAFKEYNVEADASDAEKFGVTDGFVFRGTAMAAPEPQTQPAIDQVWLMEVGETYSQNQLVTALTSNSISVPAELQAFPSKSDENIAPSEVDGIQVAAKRSQMKRALSQLSQSDAVTISAFQLSNQALANGADSSEKADVIGPSGEGIGGGAPATITPPSRAMAQKLRGNFFASPSPSSKVPETYMQLERRMGIEGLAQADEASKPAAKNGIVRAESSATDDTDLKLNNAKEMDELFPDAESDSDSEAFSNFVIIIRNEAKPAKDKK